MIEGAEFGALQAGANRRGVLPLLVAALDANRPRVLEVGSYEGGSMLILAEAIAKHFPAGGSIHCVDPWQPYLHRNKASFGDVATRMEEDLASGVVFARFRHNVLLAPENVKVTWKRGRLIDLPKAFAKSAFDLVYIDGAHDYESVISDIANASELVRPGGILCGDDLEVQLSDDNRQRTVAEAHLEWNGLYHPGVTLAVAEAFGEVWCSEGVWAMRLGDDGRTWYKEIFE